MKTAILIVLVLILVVLGGVFWNQQRERDDRLKREAAIELARRHEQSEIEASKARKRDAALKAAEGEKELDKKLKETFGY